MEYRERTYRNSVTAAGLITFQVSVRETDLFVAADRDLTDRTYKSVIKYRHQLESYIKTHEAFRHSLAPLPDDPLAPPLVRAMLRAAMTADVGPMASVAGAMAEFVGRELREDSANVIVENGGDIHLDASSARRVAIFAGTSPLSNRLVLEIPPEDMPLGVCTSSATVGPSLSFGNADAVCVLSPSAALADAAASHIGNQVRKAGDIKKALASGAAIPGVQGIVIIMGKTMGAWGKVNFCD
ncbi:MAG TPA: UPF0280 family protein [Syntrophales bacterium]|jgi:hypothetical protein|nr:UPF0280 family protein [Syntrophales bacterium]HOU76647.1 UPF0280 family protein [Syntrophales bacterium]HPC31404.1 UPF0280 family protein [Syntrophales bacterium]HQG33310.1 UPF0280 family protein [Syntrophales bacterium]HQI35086.1 UPF0280 family protein [Syntrophales bacterium]